MNDKIHFNIYYHFLSSKIEIKFLHYIHIIIQK